MAVLLSSNAFTCQMWYTACAAFACWCLQHYFQSIFIFLEFLWLREMEQVMKFKWLLYIIIEHIQRCILCRDWLWLVLSTHWQCHCKWAKQKSLLRSKNKFQGRKQKGRWWNIINTEWVCIVFGKLMLLRVATLILGYSGIMKFSCVCFSVKLYTPVTFYVIYRVCVLTVYSPHHL